VGVGSGLAIGVESDVALDRGCGAVVGGGSIFSIGVKLGIAMDCGSSAGIGRGRAMVGGSGREIGLSCGIASQGASGVPAVLICANGAAIVLSVCRPSCCAVGCSGAADCGDATRAASLAVVRAPNSEGRAAGNADRRAGWGKPARSESPIRSQIATATQPAAVAPIALPTSNFLTRAKPWRRRRNIGVPT
jgi:hypothetical protein